MTMIIDGTNGLTFNNSTTQASAGVVLQVVNATTSSQTTATTSAYVDTSLTVNITPKFSTSKILVIAYCGQISKNASDTQINFQIVRASSNIFNASSLNQGAAVSLSANATLTYFDSPATTSSTQYKIQIANRDNSGTVYFNVNGTATITLMEIAA